MKREFEIYYGSKVAGTALIESQGLYHKIECTCQIPTKELYRVFLRTATTEINLGVCIPVGEKGTTTRKIPANHIDLNDLFFYVVAKNEDSNVYIPVHDGCRFTCIGQLRNGNFCLRDNEVVIQLNSTVFHSH